MPALSTLRRFCLTLDLQDDAELIREYEVHHRRGEVWPEVIDSIRASGILDMEIFRAGRTLFMVIVVDETFSFEKKAERDAGNVKVGEWETLMERFQECDTEQRASKWRLLNPLFDLKDHD